MYNYSDKYLNKREKTIKEKYEPICFNKEIKVKNVDEIISKMCSWNPPATFYSDGRRQCVSGKGRSIIDLYRVCLYYFPETNYLKLYRTLRNRDYAFTYCPNISRTRYAGKKSTKIFLRWC